MFVILLSVTICIEEIRRTRRESGFDIRIQLDSGQKTSENVCPKYQESMKYLKIAARINKCLYTADFKADYWSCSMNIYKENTSVFK